MGCNCGKKEPAKKYVHQAPNGATKTYYTEVEARAAKIKHGGTYRVV